MNSCLFCDGDHTTSACTWVREASVWDEQRPPAPGFAAVDDEETVRRWIAAGSLRPLSDALRTSEEEARILETVHTDEDQRRRLARARRLIKAARHMRLDRLDELEGELEAAEIALPGDARTRLVEGFARLIDDDVEAALRQFEEAEKGADGDERLDAKLMCGRCLAALGRVEDAGLAYEGLVEETQGERLAAVRYELARCRVAEIRDETVR